MQRLVAHNRRLKMAGDLDLKARWLQHTGQVLPEGIHSPFNACMYRAGCQQTEADNAALRKDAERYRWLRARLQGNGLDQLDAMDAVLREDGAQMDAAIDEEIAADRLSAVGAA
jgi:hypothetical protein